VRVSPVYILRLRSTEFLHIVNVLELKPLTVDLLDAAVELDKQCFGGLWTKEGYQRELESPNSDLLVISPTNFSSEGCPISLPIIGIACLWAILDEAHITLVCVHPDYRGIGLGQALLIGLLKSANKRKLKRATLEVRVSNTVALSLYQKYGFQIAGRRRRYYADNGEDALILWRGDLQHPQFERTLAQWSEEISQRLTSYGWDLLIFDPKRPNPLTGA
jgi:[ribosomal protein S18]-alanine N-acetyltransferase